VSLAAIQGSGGFLIPIVIGSAVRDGKVLLIKRERGHFPGLWGLPGGKVEFGEHIDQAIIREIREETALEAKFAGLHGVVSEHIIEKGEVGEHLLLFVCNIECEGEHRSGGEGELKWFDLESIDRLKDLMIPSDYFMVEEMVKGGKSGGFVSNIVKDGSIYTLKEFRGIGVNGKASAGPGV